MTMENLMIFSFELSLQAFTDMQVNKIETTKKLKMLEMQAEMLKTSKKKYDITDKEISSLADDTRYEEWFIVIFTAGFVKLIFHWLFLSFCLYRQSVFIGWTNVCAVNIAQCSHWISI